MPSYTDVGVYLDDNKLEVELSDAVAECVEEETPQPLRAIGERLRERGEQMALDFDYGALTDELRKLIQTERCGPQFLRLAFNDACTYTAAYYPNGGPNAAMRFRDGEESQFDANAGLTERGGPIELLDNFLEEIGRKLGRRLLISRADLWVHAANVALEEMGGPKVTTRFGRRDAAKIEDGVQSSDYRLPDESDPKYDLKDGTGARDMRRLYKDKGLTDREIVALQGRHTVGECLLEKGAHREGAWTSDPHQFDNSYFLNLLRKSYEPHASATGAGIHRCPTSATIMLPMDMCLLRDMKFRYWVEKYSSDPAKFSTEFGNAWAKFQELGCSEYNLQPHPASLSYASNCCIPNEWYDLKLITRREHNHDTTEYGFQLLKRQSLDLPVCSAIFLKAPGWGRKAKGTLGTEEKNDGDFDGTDAVRPYVPISDPKLEGSFQILVKRYPDGSASKYLHNLSIGSKVAFRHVKTNIKHKAQWPFPLGNNKLRNKFTLICGGTGITPMIQLLWKFVSTPKSAPDSRGGDPWKIVLIYGSRTPEDILMRDQLHEWATLFPEGAAKGGELKIVHVIGESPDSKKPAGMDSTVEYTVERGWIDEKIVDKYAFKPGTNAENEEHLILVCGPAALERAMCGPPGPRSDDVLGEGSVLKKLGYFGENVVKL